MTEVMPQVPIEMNSPSTLVNAESSSGAEMATADIPVAMSPDLTTTAPVDAMSPDLTTTASVDAMSPDLTTTAPVEEIIPASGIAGDLSVPTLETVSASPANSSLEENLSVPTLETVSASPANPILGVNETVIDTEKTTISNSAPETEAPPEKAVALQQEIANWELTAQSLGGELSFAIGAFLGISKESLKRHALPEVTVQGEIIPVEQYGAHFIELKNDLDSVNISEDEYREPMMALIQMFKGNGLIEPDFELTWNVNNSPVESLEEKNDSIVQNPLNEIAHENPATTVPENFSAEEEANLIETGSAEEEANLIETGPDDMNTASVNVTTETIAPDNITTSFPPTEAESLDAPDNITTSFPPTEAEPLDAGKIESSNINEFSDLDAGTLNEKREEIKLPTPEEISTLRTELGDLSPEQLSVDEQRIEDLTKKVATATAQAEARDANSGGESSFA